VRWHRAGFRRYWRWKSRNLGGRPQISADLRALIRRMSLENVAHPTAEWIAQQITEAFPWNGELLKLGFAVAQSTVAKYMAKNGDPSGQSWGTFLRNHMPHIAAMDLFVVPTVSFDLLYVPVIVRLARRELAWINVTGVAVTRRLRAMGIRDKPIAPGSPWQNGVAERLIGTIRRECVDHVVALGEQHLSRVLKSYANSYYNTSRTHRSLDKDAPITRAVQRIGRIVSHALVGGLHHRYVRI
jgi:hypothetical protein